ncbi:membrane protein [Streptomyces rimosus subsp. pseudoverticillatus]|nr:membrane protein [Streptomyces rimosus subsp. pseudoverticillatus]
MGIVLSILVAGACVLSAVRECHGVRTVRRRAWALLDDGFGERSRSLPRSLFWDRARRRRVGWLREWARGAAVAAAVAILVGGATGVVIGLAVAYGVGLRQRRAKARAERRAAEAGLRAALAPAADLLAACLAAGAGPREAADAVGRSVDGTVGVRLRRVAAELRLGAEPSAAWQRFGELPGARDLTRCMERAGISGVPAVEGVARIAAGLRAAAHRTAAERARRAAVLVTFPLAACFLPAFLVIGVAPVLIGLAGELMAHN